MPTILRFRGFRILIWSEDHGQPHVHAFKDRNQFSFWLHCDRGTVSLRTQSRRARAKDQQALAEFLVDNLAMLQRGASGTMSKDEIKQAVTRGDELLASSNCAVAAVYRPHLKRVVVTLRSGLELAINPERHQVLHKAKPSQLREIEITPLGDALFFPKLEEGLYLPGVLKGLTGTKKWMASQAGADAEKILRQKPA